MIYQGKEGIHLHGKNPAWACLRIQKYALVYCSRDWLLFECVIGIRSGCAESLAKVAGGGNQPLIVLITLLGVPLRI
jgi:hypothetical protein